MTGADATDSTVMGTEAYYNVTTATAYIKTVAADIVTAHGSR
jgi:hypothetical protein